MRFQIDEGAYVEIDHENHMWWHDAVGDCVCIATTKNDLEDVIAVLREAGKSLPDGAAT